MDCTDAYREALIRDFSATGSQAPAPAPAPAPGKRRAAEAGRESVAGGAAAESRPATALAQEATAVDGEAIDQH
jgi:hypothetical protein